MTAILLALLSGVVLAAASDGAPSFKLEMSSGEVVVGPLAAWSEGSLEIGARGDQAGRKLAPGDVVLLTAVRPAGRARGQDVILLAAPEGGGPADRLVGRLDAGDEYGVTLDLAGSLQVGLPYEVVDRILPLADRPLDLLAGLQDGGFDDRIWKRRDDGGMDGISGVLAAASPEGLKLESAMGDLAFPLEEVLAIVLAEPEPLSDALPGWPCRLALAGGSAFAAGLLDVDSEGLTVSTGFAERLVIPAGIVDSLLFGPTDDAPPALVSRQAPVEVHEWTLFGDDVAVLFPWRRDLAVAGELLVLDGLHATSGLGVHAHSRLTFEVPEGAAALRMTVGLTADTAVLAAEGSVTFKVFVDEELVATVGPLGEQDGSRPLRVAPLRAGQRLTLEVDAGGDDEAGDRAAWADAVFLP